MANESFRPRSREVLMLEERFYAVLIALGADTMRVLARLHAALKGVGESALPNIAKLVALLFSFPVFELHNLLFKMTYALGSRRLRLIGRRQRQLGVQNVLSEFDLDLIDAGLRGGGIEALENTKARLEAAKARTDFRYPNHLSPPASRSI